MDGLLDSYLRLLLWLALGACVAVLLVPELPRLKDRFGEWLVYRRLKLALPASHYTVLRDVTLRRGAAGGVEAIRTGHVVVSPYGVFVLETNHRSGWIFGAERDEVWTRIHYRARRNFPNPVRQNQARIRALQELLELDAAMFHPLVVFTGSAEIRTPMPPHVTRLGGMLPYIQVRTAELLGFEEAARVAAVIRAERLPPGAQSAAARVARLRKTERQRFGTRQAVLGLVLMLSLSAVAGTLVHNLAEVPGQFPPQRDAALACAFSAETGLCTCADRRSGSPFGPGGWGVEIAVEHCEALAVGQSAVTQR